MSLVSLKAQHFTESIIRDMTRQALQYGAVNLSQGFPDFAAPEELKRAACDAINADINQYAITWGSKRFREAIAAKTKWHLGLEIDPEREVVVTCGSTEAMIATMLATLNPGDEVILFEPYYENYHPDLLLCGATRKLITLHAPDWTFDHEEMRRAFNKRTKAVILNTPNNPTGRVFPRADLEFIAKLCQEYDALCITDEIYEHIIYDGAEHVPVMTIPGMRECAVIVNSMSKTYSVTGWRVGWVIAAPDLTDSIRKVHDFLTVGAATPLQHAGVLAMNQPDQFYKDLADHYVGRRDKLMGLLESAGFHCFKPTGAYYIMTDISRFGFADDTTFVRHLINEVGVAAVPGSSFFSGNGNGAQIVRFCFCKKYETLEEAGHRLRKLTQA